MADAATAAPTARRSFDRRSRTHAARHRGSAAQQDVHGVEHPAECCRKEGSFGGWSARHRWAAQDALSRRVVERDNANVRGLERVADRLGNRQGPCRVAVQAQRVRVNRDSRPVGRVHIMTPDDRQRLPDGRLGCFEHSAGLVRGTSDPSGV